MARPTKTITRTPGYLRVPSGLKLKKEVILEGHDLQGSPVGEISVGCAEKGAPFYGISVVGVNNQRKSVIFEDPSQLDELIRLLTEFRNSDSFEVWCFQNAVT